MDDILKTFRSQYDDNTPIGDGLLRVNWYNGDPKQKTPGQFFVSRKRLEAAGVEPPSTPWVEAERTFSNGATEEGYALSQARIQFIGIRRQDCVLDVDGRIVQWLPPFTPRGARPEGWSIYVEALICTPGFDVPLVWASKRVKTSMGILVALRDLRNLVVEPARRHYNNRSIPVYAFWALVRGDVDARGAPVYERTSGAPVTPPKLVTLDAQPPELFRKLFVGRDLLERAEALRVEYDEWLRQMPEQARQMQTAQTQTAPAASARDGYEAMKDELEDLF